MKKESGKGELRTIRKGMRRERKLEKKGARQRDSDSKRENNDTRQDRKHKWH